ncbi:Uncharacterised protein [BD1-7 clade bacterium]|nr:Uncharacterised protein [BD1-7 clade bacterium]
MNLEENIPLRERLLNVAEKLFLVNEYHSVSIRRIAEDAGANSAMISYYFGDKHSLYNQVIQRQYDVFSETIISAVKDDGTLDYHKLFRNCYRTMTQQPTLGPFLVRIMVYRDSPGYHYLKSLLSQGQELAWSMTHAEKQNGTMRNDLNPDVLRAVSMSLSTYPMLIQSLLRDQMPTTDFDEYLDELAAFSAKIIEYGVRPD